MDGVSTYQKTIDTIDKLLELGAIVNLRSNIDRENIDEIPKLLELLKDKGWSENSKFRNYFKAVHGCYSTEEDPLTDSDIFDYISKLRGESSKKPEYSGVASEIVGRFQYLLDTGEYALFKSSYCGAVNGMLVFDPFGDIYPCWDVVGNKKHVIGRLEDDQLQLNHKFEFWQSRQPQNIEVCKTCAYALYCGGGCPAHANATGDSIHGPYCDTFKEVFDSTIPKVYEAHVNHYVED